MTNMFFDHEIYEVCRVKAHKDPGYAIAYALLELTRRHSALVDRIDDLGFSHRNNDGSGHSYPGALEKIGMEMSRLNDTLYETGSALAVAVENAGIDLAPVTK